MSQAEAFFRVVISDFSYFFRTKWLIATLISLNLSDMFVVGLTYTNLMSINYFVFFIPGVIIAGMFNAALDVGRRFHLALTEGVAQYYLTLPLSINLLSLAYLISAGLCGLVYSLMLMVIVLIFVPSLISNAVLLVLPFIFFVSAGLGGIAALINLFSGEGDRYWVMAEGVQTAFLGLSTVFYPISVVQKVMPFAAQLVSANPLSQLADMFRAELLTRFNIAGWYTYSSPILLISALLLAMIGYLGYRRVYSLVWEKGKI